MVLWKRSHDKEMYGEEKGISLLNEGSILANWMLLGNIGEEEKLWLDL